MMPRSIAACSLALALASCSPGSDVSASAGPGPGASSGKGSTGAGGEGGASASGAGGEGGVDLSSSGTGPGGAPQALGPGCLEDLRTIVDEHGEVVGECPPDKGCLEGECVEPCKAAAGSKSTIGCEYYSIPYPMPEGAEDVKGYRGPCYAAVVVNTWPTPVKMSVSRAGEVLPLSKLGRLIGVDAKNEISYYPIPKEGIPEKGAAVLFFSRDEANDHPFNVACPKGTEAALPIDTAIHDTGKNDAFRVQTDRPVTAYAVYPWGGAASYFPSAALLLPTSAWEGNYVAPGIPEAHSIPVDTVSGKTKTRPFLAVVADQDDTHVTLLPSAAVEGGDGVAGTKAGEPVEYTLSAGQYLQIVQAKGLAGSVVDSDKPVGLFVGSELFSIGGDGDTSGQMVPPIRALGAEYVAATYDLPSPAPWQIVGVVDGTKLSYDPAPPPGAPTSIDAREVVELESDTPFTVRSQGSSHPFFFAVYRPSSHAPGGPDYVGLLPPVQYRPSYVFVTDPTYDQTTLVFVRAKTNGKFADVQLDCLGDVGDVVGWKDVGDAGEYQIARVEFAGSNCRDGRHAASSAGPFGISVWGWSQAASYGYPAGGNIKRVNEVVIDVPK